MKHRLTKLEHKMKLSEPYYKTQPIEKNNRTHQLLKQYFAYASDDAGSNKRKREPDEESRSYSSALTM